MEGVNEKTIIHPLIESVKRVDMEFIDASMKVRYSAKLKDGTYLLYELNSMYQKILTLDEWVELATETLKKEEL